MHSKLLGPAGERLIERVQLPHHPILIGRVGRLGLGDADDRDVIVLGQLYEQTGVSPSRTYEAVAVGNATMLHLLGIDHTKLTYLHNGRQHRLTDVTGEVLSKVLA